MQPEFIQEKLFFHFYIMLLYRDFLTREDKVHCEKLKMDRISGIATCYFKP